MITRWFTLMAILTALQASAQTVSVSNPSFEEAGADATAPKAWTLSGGTGGWISDGGSEGKRAVSVGGAGTSGDTNCWRSENMTFEPNALYTLTFSARGEASPGGCAITGPAFCNRDLGDLSSDWKKITSTFVTPCELLPEFSYLRFGQWERKGAVAYDNIRLCRALPVYNQTGSLELGDGELVQGNTYRATWPAGEITNHVRSLLSTNASCNTYRWVLTNGSCVVYRHSLTGRAQHAAKVEVNVNLYNSGELIVEAMTPGRGWVEIGRVAKVTRFSAPLPAAMLPANELQIRLRSTGAMQLDNYLFESTIDGAPITADGKTRFVAIAGEPGPLALKSLQLQNAMPGLESTISVQFENAGRTSQHVKATLLVAEDGKEPKPVTARRKTIKPGTENIDIVLAFPTKAASYDLAVELTGDVNLQARWRESLPALLDASYGAKLSESGGSVGLWTASSGWKVSQDRPMPDRRGKLHVSAARNETEAVQLVVRPKRELAEFTVTPGALRGPKGATIPAGSIEVLRVGYVQIEQPTDRLGSVALWPDPLPQMITPLTLAGGKNHPLWVRVNVPADTAAGEYKGELRLSARGYSQNVTLHVTVYGFDLPKRMTCVTAFGFDLPLAWQYHGLTDDGQRRDVMGKYLANLGKHHITPYNPAPMDAFTVSWPAVETLKEGEPANVQIDWTAWDAAMDRAYNEYGFNSFSLPVPGMGGGTFYSRADGELQGFKDGSWQYNSLMSGYLKTVEAHLKEKGWLDDSYVYWFDEPDPRDYEFVMNGFRKLKEGAPGIHRMLTEQIEEGLIGGPDIWCPLSPAFDPEKSKVRQAEGERFWWYICCAPKEPYCTEFIDHPGTELRAWLWQTWQRNIQGILIWQSNYWTSTTAYTDPKHPQNPYADPMSWTVGYGVPDGTRAPWGNGDGRFIYPPECAASANPPAPVLEGPVDSQRWEMLRDGIEDYEYMTMLKKAVAEKKDKLSAKELADCEALLSVPESITQSMTSFTSDPATIEIHRDAVAKALERLATR